MAHLNSHHKMNFDGLFPAERDFFCVDVKEDWVFINFPTFAPPACVCVISLAAAALKNVVVNAFDDLAMICFVFHPPNLKSNI